MSAGEDKIRAARTAAEEPEPAVDNLALADLPLSDLGNARRLLERHGRDLLTVGSERPEWMVWDGRRWNRDAGAAEALKRAHAAADAVQEEAAALAATIEESTGKKYRRQIAPRIEALRKWSVVSGNAARSRGLLNAAAPYRRVPSLDLDRRASVLNVLNGSLDLDLDISQTGGFQLRPPSRSDLVTRLAGASFDPSAEAPSFRQFLDLILPDRDTQAFVQRFAGYCLSGDTDQQLVFFAIGSGANGKSTLFDVLSQVMGDYAVAIDIKTFLHDERRRGGDATPDLARLAGPRLAVAAEPETGDRLSETLLKTVTGGDMIVARGLYREPVQFMPAFKLIILSNVRPTLRGVDDGLWRRIRLVPFDQVIPVEQRRPKRVVVDELMAEASGILNWALDGYLMFREIGLKSPASVRAATEDYRTENDPVGEFLRVATLSDAASHVGASRLYHIYSEWCVANGSRAWSQTLFGRRLADLGYKRETIGVTVYLGLRIVREMFVDEAAATPEAEGVA